MTDVAADTDDAGIFALVVLATIGVAAGLAYANISLWLTVPAFLGLMVLGEVGARQLARLKARRRWLNDRRVRTARCGPLDHRTCGCAVYRAACPLYELENT